MGRKRVEKRKEKRRRNGREKGTMIGRGVSSKKNSIRLFSLRCDAVRSERARLDLNRDAKTIATIR